MGDSVLLLFFPGREDIYIGRHENIQFLTGGAPELIESFGA